MIIYETKKKNKLPDRETVVKCQESSNPGLHPAQAGDVTVIGPAVEYHSFWSLKNALHPTVSSPSDVLSVCVFHKSLQYQWAQQRSNDSNFGFKL